MIIFGILTNIQSLVLYSDICYLKVSRWSLSPPGDLLPWMVLEWLGQPGIFSLYVAFHCCRRCSSVVKRSGRQSVGLSWSSPFPGRSLGHVLGARNGHSWHKQIQTTCEDWVCHFIVKSWQWPGFLLEIQSTWRKFMGYQEEKRNRQ